MVQKYIEYPKLANVFLITANYLNYSKLRKSIINELFGPCPTQKEIDSLSKANDNLINEITGAAP